MSEEKEVMEEKPHRSPWMQILIWGGVLLLLGIVAIQLRETQRGTVRAGEKAPDFVLTTFDGDQISSTEFSGKVVVLNFWASWCKPCEVEAEDLQTAWEMYEPGGEVVFLGVAYIDTDNETTWAPASRRPTALRVCLRLSSSTRQGTWFTRSSGRSPHCLQSPR
jgi:cytochrome c biogenesis protein CcmG/thiol:disulfide interchange protein DsbE